MFKIIRSDKLDVYNETLFFITFFLYQFFLVVSYSSVFSQNIFVRNISSNVIKLSFLMIILVNFYDFLRGKFCFRESCVFFVIGLVFAISYRNYHEGASLVTLLYIAATRHIDINKIMKVFIISLIAGITFNFLSYIILQINDGTKIEYRYGIERIRYALGFTLPAFLPHFFLSLVCAIGLKGIVKKNIDYIVLEGFNIALFILTDTKNVFMCLNVYLILHLILTRFNFEIFYKIVSWISVLSHSIGAMFIYFVSIIYDSNNSVFLFFNHLTSGRIELTHNGLLRWGFRLFGQQTDMSLDALNYTYVDSAFMNILIQSGLIVLIIIVLALTISTYSAYKKGETVLIISFLVITLHGIFDTQLNVVPFNPTIFYIYPMIRYFFEKIIKIDNNK